MVLLVVFVTPIIAALALTLIYGIGRLKRINDFKTTIIKIILINLVVFILGSISLLHFEKDGLGQVIGLGIYLGSFLIIGIIDTVVLVIYRKRLKIKLD